jgi:hypothetical protein
MCVYNDHEYLEQAIEAFKDYSDKLYIIEGSWQSSQKFKAQPRSNELVYDILNRQVDNKKVFLITANEPREKDQRNVGLNLAKEDGADWCHMLDADEVYTPKGLSLIKKMLERSRDSVVGYRLNSYNFINSFKKWYNGTYMRIYRPTPEAFFYMDNDVNWPDRPNGTISNIPGRSFFHYNYVRRNVDSFWLKMKYQNDQDPSMWARLVESGKYREENGVYSIPDDCPIYDFGGKHPAIMKNHPYFKNDIFEDGAIEYE